MAERTLVLAMVILFAVPSLIAEGQWSGSVPFQGNYQLVDLVLIEVVEESVSLDVSVDGQPMITIHWSATLSSTLGKFVEGVDVHMTPQAPSEVNVGLSIYDFTLTPSQPVIEGEANISATPGTSSSRSSVLVLDATAKAQPRGTSAGVTPDSVNIQILPFYSAEAHFADTAVTIKVGDRRSFELSIENRGNSAGDFMVQVTNTGELAENGIEASVQEPTVTIGEGQSRKVEVLVKVKDGARVGGHSLLVKVTPVESRSGNVEGSALLTLDVRNAYMSAVQSVIGEPLYLLGVFALVVLLMGALSFGAFKLRSYLIWRRTLRRIRSSSGEMEEGQRGL